MNRISKTLASLVLGFAALGLVAAVPASSQAAPLELKLGHIQTEQDFWHLGSLKFKEELEKRSNGEITLKIYPNSTLGGDRDLVEGMQMGTVDFGLVAGVLGNFEKSIGLLELPYLFDSQEEFNKVIHGPIGEEIASRMVKKSGIRILNWWDRGPRQTTSNKPINKLEDLKGEIEDQIDRVKCTPACSRTSSRHRRIPSPSSMADASTKCRSTSPSPITSMNT